MSRWGQLLGWPGCDSTQETSQVKRGRDYDGERQERDVTLGVVSFFFFFFFWTSAATFPRDPSIFGWSFLWQSDYFQCKAPVERRDFRHGED